MLYNIFPEDKIGQIYRKQEVVAEAGKEMPTFGTINSVLKIGDFEFIWSVDVAPIKDDILLLSCAIVRPQTQTLNIL